MSVDFKTLTQSLKNEYPSILKKFSAEHPVILDDIFRLIEDGYSGKCAPDIRARLRKLFAYNVPVQQHTSLVGGVFVPLIHKAIVKDANQEDQKLAVKLGWILHIIQAAYYMTDDVVDGGSTRWNQDCWYLNQKSFHEQVAVNDVYIMEYCAYNLLIDYFGHDTKLCLFFVKTLFENLFRCVLGQNMDITAESKTRNGVQCDMTMDDCRQMNTLRVSYPAFYLPFCLSLQLSGVSKEKNSKLWDLVHTLALDVGAIFQIQDDFLDVFGTGDKREKLGDVRSGKKSWLYLKAVEVCDVTQKQILLENYGSTDMVKVHRVVELYEQLELEGIFKTFEKDFVEKLQKNVTELCEQPNGGGVAAAFTLMIEHMGSITE